MKYVVVTGGVVSGLGKGITISSLGRILKSSGLRVTSIKIDPYLNVDAGTMSPFEHGETFVLDDGGETDLDLGNYERFLDITLTSKHNITSGKVYKEVIKRERRGDYLGKTVQMVPHVTDMVQSWLKEVVKISVDGTGLRPDVCLVEVGGTVGDIESMIFLEALRQFQFSVGRENILFVHLSLVPAVGSDAEQKSKPTQHSVKELRSLGLSPDIIVCRSETELAPGVKQKISIFCQVPVSHIISVYNVSNIYHVPLILEKQGLPAIIKQALGLDEMSSAPDLSEWRTMASIVDSPRESFQIAIVGKYVNQKDSYLSLMKAVTHVSIHLKVDIDVLWVEASDLDNGTKISAPERHEQAWSRLQSAKGILVPGGFGNRGVEGKVLAAKYARENRIPFLGICLGMQVMTIEFARNVCSLKNANSTEFDENTPHPIVIFMPEINQSQMGGTMRLGLRPTVVSCPSLAGRVYGFGDNGNPDEETVYERHRHRYEINPEYITLLETSGIRFSGKGENGNRMVIAELDRDTHPFYFGVQFHPEFKSRPNRPSPPFFSFLSVVTGRTDAFSEAGLMWRRYSDDLQREMAMISSPVSKKRSAPIDSSPSPAAGRRRSIFD